MHRIKPDPHPTDDDLRAVYFVERQTRPHWPVDYAAGMSDPLIARIVKLIAQHVRKHAARWVVAGCQGRQPELEAVNPPPTVPEPASAPPALRRVLDFKSRAAGEREDDD